MNFIVNELSLHGQYQDVVSFKSAIIAIIRMRQLASQFSRTLYCNRNLFNAQVTSQLIMPQAVQELGVEERRVLLQWFTKAGPFWDDSRLHREDDYLESNNDIVTDTAIGEAAYCCCIGREKSVVSFSPSFWTYSPLSVHWTQKDNTSKFVNVNNYWEIDVFKEALKNLPLLVNTWEKVGNECVKRFPSLKFVEGCFRFLDGFPYSPGVSRRLFELLDVLNEIVSSCVENGKLSDLGQELYQKHFVGEKSWFSDSSDDEKSKYRNQLTFRHPERQGESVLCSWHGKIKIAQIRIHFSWPPGKGEPVYVMYIGPKITKR